jgi:hypothetical protein
MVFSHMPWGIEVMPLEIWATAVKNRTPETDLSA